MTQENDTHDKYKQEIMSLLNESGFDCVDFEMLNSGSHIKIPDLLEKNNDILIEIKVLFLNDDLGKQRSDIINKLNKGEVATYWMTQPRNFRADLDDCRRKFREYPNKKTMVVFINLMAHQEQSLEELLEGEENFRIALKGENPEVVGFEDRNREVRHNKGVEIGAISQYFPKNGKLRIIHNSFADQERKIDSNIFERIPGVSQKEYSYDGESHFIEV